MLEHRPENPAVTMEVGELCVLKFTVEFRRPRFLQETYVGPVAANGGPFRITFLNLLLFRGARMALLFGIHLVAINFIVPPGVAKISCHHVGAGMDVTDNALARRDGAGKCVFEGMSRLILWDGW